MGKSGGTSRPWKLPVAVLLSAMLWTACGSIHWWKPTTFEGVVYDQPAKDLRSSPRHEVRATLGEGALRVKTVEKAILFDVEVDMKPNPPCVRVANERPVEKPLPREWVRVAFPSGHYVDAQTDDGGAATLDLAGVPADAFFPMDQVAVVSLPNRISAGEQKGCAVAVPVEAKPPDAPRSATLSMLPEAAQRRADDLANALVSARKQLREAEARYRDAVSGPEAALRALTDASRPYSIGGDVIETRENVIVVKGHATRDGDQGEGFIVDGYIAVYGYDKKVAANHYYRYYVGQHYFLGPIYEKVWLMQSGPIMTYGDMPSDARRKIEPAEARLRKAQAAASPAFEEAKRVCAEAEAGYRASLPTDPFGLFPKPPEKKAKGGKK